MHTLLRVTMSDVEAAGKAIEDGRLEKVVKQVSEIIKPEFSFFYSDQGFRAGIFLFEMSDVAMIPRIAEPFFIEMNAKVEFLPGMNPNELMKGLSEWKKSSSSVSQSLS